MSEAERQKGTVWFAEQIRTTVFPMSMEDPGTAVSWEQLVGEAPARVENQPRDRIKITRGPFAEGELILAEYPDRLDFVYVGRQPNVDLPMLPSPGRYRDSIEHVIEIVHQWLSGFQELKRIAFAPNVICLSKNKEDSYAQLNRLLPFVNVDPESQEFLFQVNRPRKSLIVNELTVNRLSKWSAIRFRSLIGLGAKENKIETKEFFAYKLELDVNTDNDYVPNFKQDLIIPLFNELRELSEEIMEMGDIK